MLPLSHAAFFEVHTKTKKTCQRIWPADIEIFFYGYPHFFHPNWFFKKRTIFMKSIYRKPFRILFLRLRQSCSYRQEEKIFWTSGAKKIASNNSKPQNCRKNGTFFLVFGQKRLNYWEFGKPFKSRIILNDNIHNSFLHANFVGPPLHIILALQKWYATTFLPKPDIRGYDHFWKVHIS